MALTGFQQQQSMVYLIEVGDWPKAETEAWSAPSPFSASTPSCRPPCPTAAAEEAPASAVKGERRRQQQRATTQPPPCCRRLPTACPGLGQRTRAPPKRDWHPRRRACFGPVGQQHGCGQAERRNQQHAVRRLSPQPALDETLGVFHPTYCFPTGCFPT